MLPSLLDFIEKDSNRNMKKELQLRGIILTIIGAACWVCIRV